MLTMLLIIFVTFLINLILTDLIFRTDSDEFVNSLMFKIMLMNNI